MRRRAAPSLLAALLATSCAAAARPPEEKPSPPLPGQGPAEADLAGWRNFTKVNPRRFKSRGHGQVWVDIRVDGEHAAAYLARSAVAPAGMRVVMAGYDSQLQTDPTGLTAMVKMPAGYDPERGDWYYAVLDADGTTATTQGKLDLCAGCHEHVQGGDHLFGVAVP